MPLYGDLDHVKRIIRPEEVADMGEDIEERLAAIQAAVSLQLEEACGRTFGDPVADTSLLHWVGPYDTLLLNRPARSITSITTGGTVSGSTMTGGTVTPGSDLVHRYVSRDGLIHGITSLGPWPLIEPPATTLTGYRTPVLVTGDFGDTDNDADVPADVTYAANILILEQFRRETASPAGFTGPDGSTIPLRNQWNDPMVKAVIAKYSARGVLVV